MVVVNIEKHSFFKESIKAITNAYKLQYKDEYLLVCKAVKMKREMTRDQYATIEGSGNEMRALYEISETLQFNLIKQLSTECLSWFKSKEGGRWFAKTFPEFCVPKYI